MFIHVLLRDISIIYVPSMHCILHAYSVKIKIPSTDGDTYLIIYHSHIVDILYNYNWSLIQTIQTWARGTCWPHGDRWPGRGHTCRCGRSRPRSCQPRPSSHSCTSSYQCTLLFPPAPTRSRHTRGPRCPCRGTRSRRPAAGAAPAAVTY